MKVSFTANLRVSVKCKYKTRGFPYDKNNCSVTIVNLNEEHMEVTKFRLNNFTQRNILYKDLRVKSHRIANEARFMVLTDVGDTLLEKVICFKLTIVNIT